MASNDQMKQDVKVYEDEKDDEIEETSEESVGGYNFDMIGGIPKELECIICHHIIKNAVELPCYHAFCKSCLLKWEKQKLKENDDQSDIEKRPLECSQCKAPYSTGQVRESKLVDRMILNSLIAKCKQHKDGCEWTGCISEYFEMHTKYCPFIETTCLFDGCNEKFIRKHQEAHAEKCSYRTQFCEYCGEKHRFNTLTDHYASCPSYPMDCPNEECNMKYERNKLKFHLTEECMFEFIQCPYGNIGCQSSFKRKELESHEAQFNSKHSILMLRQISKVTTELKETKIALEKTTTELHDTKATLCETNKILEETRANLVEVQDKVADNYQEMSETLLGNKSEIFTIMNDMNKKLAEHRQDVEETLTQTKNNIENELKKERQDFWAKFTKDVEELNGKDKKIEDKILEQKNILSSLAEIVSDDVSTDIAMKLDQVRNPKSVGFEIDGKKFRFKFDYEIYMMRIMREMKSDKLYPRSDGTGRYIKIKFQYTKEGFIKYGFPVSIQTTTISNKRDGILYGNTPICPYDQFSIRIHASSVGIDIHEPFKICWLVPIKEDVSRGKILYNESITLSRSTKYGPYTLFKNYLTEDGELLFTARIKYGN